MEKAPSQSPDMVFTYTPPGPPAEVAPTPTPTAAELLTQHVDEVRRNGNAIDHIWTYKLWPSIAASVPPGFTSGALLSLEHTSGSAALITGTVVLSGLTTLLAGAYVFKPRLQRREDHRDTSRYATQREVGEWYSLWPTGRKKGVHRDVVMEWHGPKGHFEQEVTDGNIMRIATLAKNAGVSELAIGERMLAARTDQGSFPVGYSTSMQGLIRHNHRQLVDGGNAAEVVVVATPEQWQDYIRRQDKDKKYDPLHLEPHHAAASVIGEELGIKFSERGLALFFPATAATKHPVELPGTPEEQLPMRLKDRLTIQDQLGLGWRPNKKNGSKVFTDPTRRIIGFAFSVFTSMALGASVHLAVNDRMETLEHQAAEQIARQHGKDPKDADVDPLAAQEEVASWNRLNTIPYRWQDIQDQTYMALGEFGAGDTGGFGTAGPGENPFGRSVGNIDTRKPDKSPVWRITPHNIDDQQLRGHWASGVYNFVELNPAKHGDRADITWTSGAEHYTNPLARTHNTLVPDDSMSSVEVNRTIDTETEAFTFNGSTYIPIPVLATTSVITAQLNGKPVDVIHKRDGTYAMQIQGNIPDEHPEVRYWLTTPIDGATASEGPRAVGSATFVGTNKTLKLEDNAAVADAQRAFTNRLSDADKANANVMAQYIRTAFHYRYAPFPHVAICPSTTGLIIRTPFSAMIR